jgi:rubrerythrin
MNAVELAMKMEQDAIDFYGRAAELTKHPVGKKMFLSIMEDEKRHLKVNECILNRVKIDPEQASPLKAIKTIFADMKEHLAERVQATTDEMQALKTAMEMEKEGVEYYKKLAAEAKDPKEKKLFEMLISEEEQHYQVFANTYFFMSDSGSWFMWEEHSIVDGGTPWA